MIEDVRLSLERGQKIEEAVDKSEQLATTSKSYKRTSKQVERAFCWRKWKIILLAFLVLAIIGVFIWLIIPKKNKK